MIACGWCGKPTEPDRCGVCGRDPVLPWTQRGLEPPESDAHTHELATAAAELRREGRRVTAETLAERLGVSPRTVRRWQEMAG